MVSVYCRVPYEGWVRIIRYDVAVGTPFEGGVFKMKLVLGSDFPNAPPKGMPPCTINCSLFTHLQLALAYLHSSLLLIGEEPSLMVSSQVC